MSKIHSLSWEKLNTNLSLFIEEALKLSQYFIAVERPPLSESGQQMLTKLSKLEISSKQQTSWPGTEILSTNDIAIVHKFKTDVGAECLIVPDNTRLDDWIGPNSLEDLCFLRADGSAWFISITHERDAYFELQEIEEQSFLTIFHDFLDHL